MSSYPAPSAETKREHRASWFVYVDAGERIPWQSTMRGQWAFDVVCSCGWETKTGGGTRRYVREQLDDHRSEAEWDKVNVGI